MPALNVEAPEFQNLSPFDQLVTAIDALPTADGGPGAHEAAYRESLRAIEDESFPRLCAQLGELLSQIVLQARLASGGGHFDIQDVCAAALATTIERYPQVLQAGSPGGPSTLTLALQLQKRAARAGFTYANVDGAWSKLFEEIAELQAEPSEDELGDILMACVSVARHLNLDPESALRATCRKFRYRFDALEQRFGPEMTGHSLEELTTVWKAAKEGT